MQSQLLEMWRRHEEEVDNLRKTCPHNEYWLKIRHDKSSVGAGTIYGSVVVTCRNCGTQKIIFDLNPEQRKKVKKTLKRQGFKDERLDSYVQYPWEVNKP